MVINMMESGRMVFFGQEYLHLQTVENTLVSLKNSFQGYGTFYYPDGSKYAGHYVNGKRNGFGTYSYPDGAEYSGEFKDENFHGRGKYKYADGDQYVGEFKDDRFHGLVF